MKKIVTVGISALLGLTLITGCGSDTNKDTTPAATASNTSETQSDSNIFKNLTNTAIGRALYFSEKVGLSTYANNHQKVADLLKNSDPKKGVRVELRQNGEIVAKPGNVDSGFGPIYVGELTPDRRPTGWGVIYDGVSKAPRFVGEFNAGHLSGYGVAAYIYSDGARIGEGNFANPKEVPGILYTMNNQKIVDAAEGELIYASVETILDPEPTEIRISQLNGHYTRYADGHKYYEVSIPDNKYIVYGSNDREIFKADTITEVAPPKDREQYKTSTKYYLIKGKGQVYYSNGQVKYSGDYINETSSSSDFVPDLVRQGQGTSYKEDGSIEYQGEWVDDKYK